jgi:hypothetical protein
VRGQRSLIKRVSRSPIFIKSTYVVRCLKHAVVVAKPYRACSRGITQESRQATRFAYCS